MVIKELNNKMIKKPIKINAELHKSIKIFCVAHDISITDFVEKHLVQGLEQENKVIK